MVGWNSVDWQIIGSNPITVKEVISIRSYQEEIIVHAFLRNVLRVYVNTKKLKETKLDVESQSHT